MLLKADGGPNHANNQCDSPILLDATNTSRVYKQPMYYALAHFSAFIPPGANRIQSVSSGGTVLQPNMESVAFTKDGVTSLVVLNRDYFFGRTFHLHDKQRGFAEVSIPPASMMTIVFNTVI
jgi:glucosylceramidase